MAHTAIGERTDIKARLAVLKIEHALNENMVLKSITGILDTGSSLDVSTTY